VRGGKTVILSQAQNDGKGGKTGILARNMPE